MNLNQRGQRVKKKTQMLSKGKSDSGRTSEMVVIPSENLLEMREK